MIKKYTLIILAALAALSCTREIVPDSGSYGTVEVDFSVSVPDGSFSATKAFADDPDIKNLYVAMFDAAGYLVQYTKAECTDGYPSVNDDKTTDAIEGAKKYKVTLYVTNSALKVIHFIANGPSSVKYGSEEEVIASMIAYKTPADGQIGPDVYWQRIELPKGVTYNSDTDLTLISESANLLKSVGLIRNFAKFTISNNAANFELTGAKILMTPDCGYVAPYNKKTGGFVTNYAALTVDELAAAGYTGSAPATAKVTTDFSDDGVLSTGSDGKISTYTFEREKPTSAPACILVKGKYDGSSDETWYKVNLTDYQTGDYYAIMRNFNYTVEITKVSGAGKTTQAAAYNSVGSGDISTTFEYKEITAMSNGASKLEVQYTSKLVVSSSPFTLKYKFAPDLTTTYDEGTTHAGKAVIVNEYKISSDDTVIPLTDWNESGVQIYLDEAGANGAAIQSISVADADNTDDLSRTITVTPTAVSGTTKTQDIVLVGRYKASDGASGYTLKPITRVVTIMVHEKYSLTATCTPSAGVARTIGTPFTLSFTLPSGLPKACFPLQFNIEAQELSISPVDGDLTICKGNSTIEGSTRRSSYYYVKTLNWSDYYNSTTDTYTLTHSANFKTNTENSATRIYLSNEYFNQTYTSFSNPALLNTTMTLNGTAGTLSFDVETSEEVTLTLNNFTLNDASGFTSLGNGVYTYTPAAGSQSISLTLTDANAPCSVSVQAASDAAPQTFAWSLSQPAAWYTKADETGGVATIAGATTTVYADVQFGSTEDRSVTFNIGGSDYTGTLVSETASGCRYKYEYTVPDTYASAGGYIPVTVTASDASWTSAATSFGDIVVWKTVTSSQLTELTDIAYVVEAEQVLIKNANYSTYLINNSGSLSASSDFGETAYWKVATGYTIQSVYDTTKYLRISTNSSTVYLGNSRNLTVSEYSGGFLISYTGNSGGRGGSGSSSSTTLYLSQTGDTTIGVSTTSTDSSQRWMFYSYTSGPTSYEAPE